MEEQKVNRKRKEKNILEIFFIVMVIVLVLFLIIERIGKLNNFIPTGYVDVFDLHFGYMTGDDYTYTNNYNFGSIGKDSKVETNPVIIYDDDSIYKNNEAKIFSHSSYYIRQGKIAPTSKNSYKFIVRNGNEYPVKYNLVMSEENNYNINMKFRLKYRGSYVIGDEDNWVTANELKRYEVLLASNSYDTYELDWCWFEGDNDTKIGTDIESKYKLFIGMYAEQY